MSRFNRHKELEFPRAFLVSLLIVAGSCSAPLFSLGPRAEAGSEISLVADNVPIRLYPDFNSIVIRMIRKGTRITIETEDGDWIRISLPPDRQGHSITGYLHRSDISTLGTVSGFKYPSANPTARTSKKKRFQFDVQGGWAFIDPAADLNARPIYDLAYDGFYRTGYYDYWSSEGELVDWGVMSEGDLHLIESALPFGCSLRYHLLKNIAISATFRYLWMTRKSTMRTYEHAEWIDGYSSRILEEYSPYILRIEEIRPMLGVHLVFQGRTLGLELGFLGGLGFARFGNSFEYQYQFYGEWDYWSQSQLHQEASGKNTSLALEGAVRANINISPQTGFYFEGAYSYKKPSPFSGKGSARYHRETSEGDSYDDSWEWSGEWAMKEITYQESWGTLVSTFPSNDWAELAPNERLVRDFVLDLSGLQIKAGLFIRF